MPYQIFRFKFQNTLKNEIHNSNFKHIKKVFWSHFHVLAVEIIVKRSQIFSEKSEKTGMQKNLSGKIEFIGDFLTE